MFLRYDHFHNSNIFHIFWVIRGKFQKTKDCIFFVKFPIEYVLFDILRPKKLNFNSKLKSEGSKKTKRETKGCGLVRQIFFIIIFCTKPSMLYNSFDCLVMFYNVIKPFLNIIFQLFMQHLSTLSIFLKNLIYIKHILGLEQSITKTTT